MPSNSADWKIKNRERVNEYNREYRKNHPEMIRKSKKKYAEKHVDEIKAYNKNYRAEHKEEKRVHDHEYYLKHQDKLKLKQRLYRIANPEAERMRVQNYQHTHQEELKEYRRNYRNKNKEKINAFQKEWYKSNRAYCNLISKLWRYRNLERARLNGRVQAARRRMLMLENGGSHTKQDILNQYHKQDGKCYWCSKIVDKTFDVDHVIPVTRGGSNDPVNLVISCRTCNRSRNNKLPEEWKQS